MSATKTLVPATGREYRRYLVDFSIITYKALEPVEQMTSPVICNHCNMVYDLAAGKVVHRYMDCTQYRTPCCNKLADDRMWVSFPSFKKFDASKFELVEQNEG